MTVELSFIKTQFRTNVKNIFHRINEGTNTSDYGLSHPFKGPGAVSNGLSGIKMRR